MRTPGGPPAAVLPRSVSRMFYFPELWARTASQPSAQAAALALFTEIAKTRRFRIALFSARCKQNAAPPPAAAQHPQPVTAGPARPRLQRERVGPGPAGRPLSPAALTAGPSAVRGRPLSAAARKGGPGPRAAAIPLGHDPVGCDPVQPRCCRPRSRWGAILSGRGPGGAPSRPGCPSHGSAPGARPPGAASCALSRAPNASFVCLSC